MVDADQETRKWAGATMAIGFLNLLVFMYGAYNNVLFHFDAYGVIPFFAGVFAIFAGSMVVCCGAKAMLAMAAHGITAAFQFFAIISIIAYVAALHELLNQNNHGNGMKGSGKWHLYIAFECFVHLVGSGVCAMTVCKARQAQQAHLMRGQQDAATMRNAELPSKSNDIV